MSIYKATDFQKNKGQIPPILQYIESKIKNGTNPLEMNNGFYMIRQLQDPHRDMMMNICKEYFIEHLTNNSLSYTDKDLLQTVKSAMYALGTIRKDHVINFLLPFIKQPQFWKNNNLPDLELNVKDEVSSDNYVYLIGEIRYSALGAIMGIDDSFSRDNYVTIENIINGLPKDDFQKKYLLRNFGTAKKIHAGQGLKNIQY